MDDKIQGSTWSEEHLGTLYKYEQNRSLILRATRKIFSSFDKENFQGNERILEVGSGMGFLRRNWPNNYRGEWVQLDSQPVYLEEAKRRFPKGTYICGSVYQLPFPDESFDVVCGFNSYDNFFDLETAIQETARVIKPSGLLLHMLDLIPNREPLYKYLENPITLEGWEAGKQFTERLVQSLSSHFNPETIESGGRLAYYVGRRTEQQRQSEAFFFANHAGNYYIERSAINHSFKDSVPTIPRIFVPYEYAHRALRRSLPLVSQIIEPPCIEVSVITYAQARK